MSENKQSAAASVGIALLVAIVVLLPLGGLLMMRFVLEPPGMRGEPVAEAPARKSSPSMSRASAAAVLPDYDDDAPSRSWPPKPASSPAVSGPAPASSGISPVRPVPAPSSIAVGTEKAKLINSYGKPHMVTIELEQGQPVETFHYVNKEVGTETIVRLRGGRVVSAGATVY
jgi:hypothetical protein